MQIYLVGGAVRDHLLGQISADAERDFVVVGATENEMLALGYRKVGRDFPVFLHPVTHEEYALARTERKTGKGYTEFVCNAAPTVTLEEDLLRRDLTINAIAQAADGTFIDPYGGMQDLSRKILRHVSPAFIEDPLRVLRVARFAATFSDFTVHPTTRELMIRIAHNGELGVLTPERVWQELRRTLHTATPQRFFTTLQESAAIEILFPEINAHFASSIAALQLAVLRNANAIVRFAAVLGVCEPKEVMLFSKRYRIPHAYTEVAELVARYKSNYRDILHVTPEQILHLLEALDALRRSQRFEEFIAASEAVITIEQAENTKSISSNNATTPYCNGIKHISMLSTRAAVLMTAYAIVKQVDVKKLIADLSREQKIQDAQTILKDHRQENKKRGTIIKTALQQLRLAALRKNLPKITELITHQQN